MTVTIQTILDSTHEALQRAELFYGHGSDNAWDEAVFLVLSACGLELDVGDEVLARIVTDAEKAQIDDWLQKRIEKHLPLPYITHQAWFCGLPFYVDERVLVPRSPFAEWINKQFEPWCRADDLKQILEIGTGSGCIAIATALALPDAKVDACDISVDALQVATKNIAEYKLQDRVKLFESDVYAHIPEKKYDLIISNPPYVSADEMNELPEEYLQEPQSGLEADNDGMAIVDKILKDAAKYLQPKGYLMVEVGYSQEIGRASCRERV